MIRLRRPTRKELLRDRERFLAVFENTIDYVGLADADGTLLYANRAVRQLVGLGIDEDITNRTIADCWWHENASTIVAEAYEEVKQTGGWSGELTWQGRDGLTVPMLVTAMAHKTETGQVEYCSMVAHDLRGFESTLHALNRTLETRVAQRTAHLRATHEQLREEEKRAQRYLDVAGVALVALDLEGRVTMINKRGCTLLEDTEENILGRNWFDEFLTGEARQHWSTFYANVVQGKEDHLEDGELWVRTRGNNQRLIAWHSALLKDDSGNLIGVIGSGEDITDSQRAKEALQASEAQLRVISDSLPVLISQIDSQLRYTFNNAAYESFFGIPRESLKGTYIRDLIGEHAFATCQPHIRDALAGRPSVFEMQFADKEGLPRDATVHLVPDQHNHGEVSGFYAVITDITERKQLESALRQSQKMEAVGLLASGISHDFNNLLMGIGGCSNVALERLEPDSPVRIFLEEIRSAASSGASISRQLVDLSRHSKEDVADACLDALVADVESMLRRLLGADVLLRLDLQAGSARSHFGRGQFKQVLLNLVVNARDSLGDGGTIDVETRVVELGADEARRFGGLEPGNYVTLTVRDNGAGMDAATVERIFEPFFTTKEVGRGSGLGLYTVYNIIAQQGGHIDVVSAPGKGTTFTLYLPRSESDTAIAEIEEVHGRRGNETILVVEDDRLVQLAVREYLGRWGYRVIEASDGNQAVQVARAHHGPIPLLISDMVLPGMPGSKVAKAVLEIHPEAKVIYMSAHSPAMLAEAGHLEKGTDTLQKPFGEAELLERVSQVLGDTAQAPTYPE